MWSVAALRSPLVRREPVRPLPAVLLAEHGAERLHAVVAGRGLQRPRRGALLVRVVGREDVGVGLLVLDLEIALRRVGAEAARVDAQHVDRGLALDDPFGELPAGAAGRGDAEAEWPSFSQKFLRPQAGPTIGLPSGRVGDGAVVDLLDADLAEGRHAVRSRPRYAASSRSRSSWNSSYSASSRRPVDVAAGRALLVGPEQQAARLLAHVPGAVALAQHAHLGQALLLAALWISGCGSVTIYWCSTGMTGMSSPTIAPVRRAKLPVAVTTCSQAMSPLSVCTSHSPDGCCSMPVTVVLRWISAPRVAGAAAPAPGSGRRAGCSRHRDAGSRRGCRRYCRAARSP